MKKILGKIGCWLDFHDWSYRYDAQWYVQMRTCSKCGQKQGWMSLNGHTKNWVKYH